jgi:hypothetical protein
MSTINFISRPISWNTILKRMILGAGIGLFLISFFVFGVDEPHPDWPKNWMLKPLIITPMIAALGAAFSTTLDPLRQQGGWKTFAAVGLSLLVFLVALWMGVVLGLNGTMWD